MTASLVPLQPSRQLRPPLQRCAALRQHGSARAPRQPSRCRFESRTLVLTSSASIRFPRRLGKLSHSAARPLPVKPAPHVSFVALLRWALPGTLCGTLAFWRSGPAGVWRRCENARPPGFAALRLPIARGSGRRPCLLSAQPSLCSSRSLSLRSRYRSLWELRLSLRSVRRLLQSASRTAEKLSLSAGRGRWLFSTACRIHTKRFRQKSPHFTVTQGTNKQKTVQSGRNPSGFKLFEQSCVRLKAGWAGIHSLFLMFIL